jgi:predicted aminopeptidase
MLAMSDLALIELIIHELAHATVYIPNQTPFNETFANFVGKMGAKVYLEERFGVNSQQSLRLNAYHLQLKIYRDFFYGLYGELEQLYGSRLPDEQKKLDKIKLIDDAKIRYLKLPIEEGFKNIDWSQVNNAYLLSFKSYNQDDAVFEELFAVVNRDFGKFLEEVDIYGRTKDPYASLSARVNSLVKKQ